MSEFGAEQPVIQTDINSLTAYQLPSFPSFDLPPLPPINDPHLERIIDSYTSTGLRPLVFDQDVFVMDRPDESYFEELQLVGNALLEATATTWGHDTFPAFRQGASSQLQSHLIRKSTLCQVAVRYNLHTKVNYDPKISIWTATDIGRAQSAVFEAHIGAVYYSLIGKTPTKEKCDDTPDQTYMQTQATEKDETEDKSSIVETHHVNSKLENSSNEISPNNCKVKTRGQAFEYLYSWLSHLFKLMSKFILEELKKEESRFESSRPNPRKITLKFPVPPEWELEDTKARGGKHVLHAQHQLIKVRPTYTATALDGHWDVQPWKVVCTAVDVNGKEWIAEATRIIKKKAENMAAWKICVEMGLISVDE
ncbi:hypothetical protein I203_102044 [Kwoniella mangroviensis CBS 8507]|uniref:uncharacterized protein n=1 Tax=Kwoniella mangroviensis CBS 8507 TaxID=1296122 RepID=UPI00080CE94B|nr:uncharacterized protein I203_03239 [Kwoniella mangroviensis CBS 8507]OCF67542.1 hypothetical protein I203_03239 [Kwoniella mangroviensis CBS 8507]